MHPELVQELARQRRAQIRADMAACRACVPASGREREVRKRVGLAVIRIGLRLARVPGSPALRLAGLSAPAAARGGNSAKTIR
jgi:hypothetical protein